MSTQNSAGSSHSGGNSVGVGSTNDRDAGSQQASGGSGASQLTRGLDDTHSGAPSVPVGAAGNAPEEAPEGEGSASTAATRGAQDTHSRQAGSTPTGLGAPETGANQSPGDLAPKK
ncbi:MAG: hypothetical protein M3R60_17955 [Pseudomonadota bacterium]|nr:hypothetical protein [Pseudomonadota bacterium]